MKNNDYARKRDLIGRTIVGVRWFRFRARPASDNTYAQQPRLLLDNGRALYFVTQETDVGDYGTRVCISPKARRSA